MTTTYSRSRISDLLGRRDVTFDRVVHIAEVGSTAHGISTSETGDDLDLTVVRIEDFDELVVGDLSRQSMMIRTQPEGVRSRMGDIDLQVYTLRKFAGLALVGNPSILGAIFSQRVYHHSGVNLADLAGKVASKRAGAAFLGYMRQQIERWQGVRGQKNVSRPELVEAYGFDTKDAAHVIRLGWQGIEDMSTGRFSMPMPQHSAEMIRNLRTGRYTEPEALAWAEDVEAALKEAIGASRLPDQPAVQAANRWVAEQYRNALEKT